MSNLYGWCSLETNHKATRETLELLAEQGGKTIADMEHFIVVKYNDRWYTLCDNGGEINVEAVNLTETLRSVPYISNADTLTTGTMLYRLLAAMRGEEIDYDWRAEFGFFLYDMQIWGA